MNYPTVVNDIDFRDLIFVANNDPVTDSFMVAKAFGKLPKNVVRDIERTIEACPPEFDTKLNFELCYKNNELQNGKPQKFYRLRKDGLMLLVMSYTKKEAMRIKIAYINAFNWMYAMLQVGQRVAAETDPIRAAFLLGQISKQVSLAPKPKKAIKPEPEVRGGGADAKQDEFNKLCPGAKIE